MYSNYAISDDESILLTLQHISRVLGEPCALHRGFDRWIVMDAEGNTLFSSYPSYEQFRHEYGKWLAPHNGGIPF